MNAGAKKVFCIGSAVMDVLAAEIPPESEWQEKQRVREVKIMAGGDAANQAIHLADLGFHPVLLSAVGDDRNGEILRNLLQARGVDVSCLSVKKDVFTGTSVVLVGNDGERHIFSSGGAHSLLGREDIPASFPEDASAVSLASLFSIPELEADGLLLFLEKCRGKGIPVFADLGTDKKKQGFHGLRPFLPYLTWFLPSDYDACRVTGEETPEKAAARFRAAGVPNVVIKCGAEGLYYDTPQGQGRVPARRVIPVDTTGAGDCMVSLFIGALLSGRDYREALLFSAAGASLSTLFPGASGERITAERIETFLAAEEGPRPA